MVGVIPEPSCTSVLLEKEVDFLVLACDGLFDVMTYQQVVDFVRAGLERNFGADSLATAIVRRALRTSTDNVSVIVVLFRW
jgi:serine/threonine protein phosphatase PrpC